MWQKVSKAKISLGYIYISNKMLLYTSKHYEALFSVYQIKSFYTFL